MSPDPLRRKVVTCPHDHVFHRSAVEVDPLFKKEIKFSEYKKVRVYNFACR